MKTFHEQYRLTFTHIYVYEDGSVSDNKRVDCEEILNEMSGKIKEYVKQEKR